MTLRNEVRFEDLEEHDTVLPADAELLVQVGDTAKRAPVSQLPDTHRFDIHDDVTTEETTPQDADRVAVSAEDETGDPMRWLSLSRLANYVKGKIGAVTSSASGLMTSAMLTLLNSAVQPNELRDSSQTFYTTPDLNGTLPQTFLIAQGNGNEISDWRSDDYDWATNLPAGTSIRITLANSQADHLIPPGEGAGAKTLPTIALNQTLTFYDASNRKWVITITSAPTTVTGNEGFSGKRYNATVASVDAGFSTPATDFFRVSDHERPKDQVDWDAVRNPPWVNTNASNAATFAGTPDDLLAVQGGAVKKYDFDDARRHLLGPKNHVGLGTFTVSSSLPTTAGKVYIQSIGQGFTDLQVAITWSTTDEETDLGNYLIVGQRLNFGNGFSGEITGNINKNTIANGGYGFHIAEFEGTPPSSGDTGIVAEGQERVTRLAYIETVQNNGNLYYGSSEPDLLALDKSAAVHWKANVTSTGAATLNVNALGAKSVKKPDGSASAAGDIVANTYYLSILRDDAWITYGIAPDGFDLHDDVTTALDGFPDGDDRFPVSDEGTTGDPMRYVNQDGLDHRLVPSIEDDADYASYSTVAGLGSLTTAGQLFYDTTTHRFGVYPNSGDVDGTLARIRKGSVVTVRKDASNYATFTVKSMAYSGGKLLVTADGSISVTGTIALGSSVSLRVATPNKLPTFAAPQTNSDIGLSDENIATNLNNDDFLCINITGTDGSDVLERTISKRFGNIGTTERVLLGLSGFNKSVLLTRSGTALQARRNSALSGATSEVYVIGKASS